MCLAVPAQIVAREGDRATVDLEGVRREASLALLPEAALGDWVLLHAGFAISRMDEAEARETLALQAAAFGRPGGAPE